MLLLKNANNKLYLYLIKIMDSFMTKMLLLKTANDIFYLYLRLKYRNLYKNSQW